MRQMRDVRVQLSGMSLDFRVGVRLLIKHKWLTATATLALAFAIWLGAIAFEFYTQIIQPKVPLENPEQLVGVAMLDVARGRLTEPTLHDFAGWRDALTSVRDLSAFREVELNVVANGAAEPVQVAEITATAFQVAGTRAALGRPIAPEDEQPGAPAVVVIAHDVWQTRFAASSSVIGQQVRLGGVLHTVVGVMPPDFGFPVAHHFWIPFRLDPRRDTAQENPDVHVFGRMAPNASLETVQAQLTALALSAPVRLPAGQTVLKPRTVSYVQAATGRFSTNLVLSVFGFNALAVALAFLLCGNIALLMFARAAARTNEILVRVALGASRGRITAQFFVEALVLAMVAVVVGLAAARFGWGWAVEVAAPDVFGPGALPFWIHRGLSPTTVLYAVLLSVLAASITGCIPGLKVTRSLAARLHEASAGGGGLGFGRVWTAMFVTQVAVTAVVPVLLNGFIKSVQQERLMDPGFPTQQYLTATLTSDELTTPGVSRDTLLARFTVDIQEVERRLETDPGVTAVTFANNLPLSTHLHRHIEIDSGAKAAKDAQSGDPRISTTRVALDFFDVFKAPILLGRGFHASDLLTGARTVVVNESFVRRVLRGGNPIGRRFRYTYYDDLQAPAPPNEPWYEIVGVVRDMGMALPSDELSAGIYHPLALGRSLSTRIAVHLRGDPLRFAPTLRAIATQAAPTLQLDEVRRLDQASETDARQARFIFWTITEFTSVSALLALVGLYTAFSYVITQRTREVGIRVALGGRPLGVTAAVCRRPLIQVGAGIAIGLVLAFGASGGDAVFVLLDAAAIVALCLLAVLGPVRRALCVQPIEALRTEP